LRPCGKR
jgi:hypothetical protein